MIMQRGGEVNHLSFDLLFVANLQINLFLS